MIFMAQEPTLIKDFIKLSAGPSPIIVDEDGDRQIEVVSVPASLSAVGVAGEKYYLDDTLREATDPNIDHFITKGGKKIPIFKDKNKSSSGQQQEPQPKQPGKEKPISLTPKSLLPTDKPISLKPEELIPVDFDTATKNFANFIAQTKSQDYSFDPKLGKAWNAQSKPEAQAFHQRFSDGEHDVFVIGVTNHAGQLSRESHSAYEQIKNENRYPLIGHWVSQETGFDYTDISFPIDHGTTEEDALALAKEHGQESIVAVTKRGTYRFVNVI